MKILMYGDLQTNRKQSTYSSFLDKTMEYLFQQICLHTPDLVVNMGDLLDTHGAIDVEDLVWSWSWMKGIEGRCPSPSEDGLARHWIVKGNHDISDRNAKISSVSVMEGINTDVLIDPVRYRFTDGSYFLVLPYTRDYGPLRDWLEAIPDKEQVDVILGHVEWFGARYTPYRVSDIGLDPAEMQEMFPNAEIFNGHYHHPDSTGRLHMVGSPLHKDFNDVAGELQRGFVLYDTETRQVTRISNPHTYYCLSFEFQDEANLIETAESLQDVKEQVRVKVSVPTSLVDEAEYRFKDFLWKSVTPTDSQVNSIFQGEGLKVCSSPADVVNRGVSTASTEIYDPVLLSEFGKEAFGL